MTLTKQEQEAIEAAADEHYWIMTEDSFDDSGRDYDDYVMERKKLQRAYITAATAYALKAKGLAEALEKIRQEAINNGDRHGFEIEVHNIAKEALSTYILP